MGRTQVNANLLAPVLETWNKTKEGHTNTRFAMAGAVAMILLEPLERTELMTLVAAVDEGREEWTAVLDWAAGKAADRQAVLAGLQRNQRGKRRTGKKARR